MDSIPVGVTFSEIMKQQGEKWILALKAFFNIFFAYEQK